MRSLSKFQMIISGAVKLDPCSPGSSSQVTVNSTGSAQTSACPKPGEGVSLTVVQGGLERRVPEDQVTIERAGDGLPVAIKASVPVR